MLYFFVNNVNTLLIEKLFLDKYPSLRRILKKGK